MTGLAGSETPGRHARAAGRRHLAVVVAIAFGVAAASTGCTGSSATPQTIFIAPTPGASSAAPTMPVYVATTANPSPTPTGTPIPTIAPIPTPTPVPPPGPCNASYLTLTIQSTAGIYWQGSAGHELATFVLKNTGALSCTVKAKDQALLLNGDDSILILGTAAGTSALLTLAPGGKVHSDVETGNLCDAPTIIPPVRVAFMVPGGTGLVVATPLLPTDEGGVPPCLGDPSVYSGSISMQPWAA